MISGINEKRLSKKYLVKVRPFPGASADDMHHYLRHLLQKWPDTIILRWQKYLCKRILSYCARKNPQPQNLLSKTHYRSPK